MNIALSPFQALQAQLPRGNNASAPAPLLIPQPETGEQQGPLEWKALGNISDAQQLQLSDQLRFMEAQVALQHMPLPPSPHIGAKCQLLSISAHQHEALFKSMFILSYSLWHLQSQSGSIRRLPRQAKACAAPSQSA